MEENIYIVDNPGIVKCFVLANQSLAVTYCLPSWDVLVS